jgi:hypothetical protein
MRLFKTRSFARDADCHGLTDEAIKGAVQEILNGLVDAHLGGSLVKKRISIGSKGKRGGLRSLIVYRSPRDNLFCVYLFSKKETENISRRQLQQLNALATTLLALDERSIRTILAEKELIEVAIVEEAGRVND